MLKLVGLFFLCISLVACSQQRETAESIFPKLSVNLCPGSDTTEFIAQWNDGRITKEKAESREELLERLVMPNVDKLLRVEPDFKVSIEPLRVDTNSAPINWHHLASGSLSAWTQNIKGQGVVIAVTDSGVDIEHPKLVNQIYVNPNEIADNGIDDDGNGLIDDIKGYDFFSNIPTVSDPGAHGTHVAGIIAAEHSFEVTSMNQVVGVPDAFGIAPEAKILPIRFLGPNGEGSVSGAVAAINYAANMGADIINASWGGAECSQILINRILQLREQDVLFVSAAGNENTNVDLRPIYPGNIESDMLINVAATSTDGSRSSFSNYGLLSVDVGAPGVDIFSTVPANNFAVFSGTSMAAPIVAGLAALLKSKNQNLSSAQIKAVIEQNTNDRRIEIETRGEIDIQRSLDAI